ncbi:hypothetical protein EZV62_005581 [Acer yangbiense]|uniref:Leucine-rich repeat-containing N-terminal plant-type domain-containing protein n=1 Tax=Acer yangbiense TaxID=1000413 RepID=A0A5C7GPK6_9ROSI|nr:hypothetical protein EZV62_027932 [Acer yangbiense]TXG70646.1 hypothetical protein EZV62_005581 [Acer yangbiense]
MASQGKYSLPALYLYVASQSNSAAASPCRWRGISCDDAGTLTEINLSFTGLTGTLQNLDFSSFLNLLRLDLKTNKLSGSVPNNIGLLSKLQFLDLSRNDLNGTLPLSLANLTQVYELDISRNNIVGEIDACLFPDGTGQSRTGLIGLKYFLLQENQLGGRIPEEIGNSKLLTLIALDGNFLTGPIPASLGNLSSLSILSVAVNQLAGQIPTNIGTLNNWTDVRLFGNKLTGLVPEELGNLSSLTVLHLAENNFSGHLPQEVCRGGKLVNFSASFNSFTGPVPVSLRDCQSLYRVRLEYNHLTGILDRDFGVYPNLTYMDLSYNKLHGEVSPKWGQCQKLTLLKIAGNSIGGRIPDEITSLNQLVELDLSSNQLTGKLPEQIGNLKKLSILSLENNNILGYYYCMSTSEDISSTMATIMTSGESFSTITTLKEDLPWEGEVVKAKIADLRRKIAKYEARPKREIFQQTDESKKRDQLARKFQPCCPYRRPYNSNHHLTKFRVISKSHELSDECRKLLDRTKQLGIPHLRPLVITPNPTTSIPDLQEEQMQPIKSLKNDDKWRKSRDEFKRIEALRKLKLLSLN